MKLFKFLKENFRTPYNLVFLNRKTLTEDYSMSLRLRNLFWLILSFTIVLLLLGMFSNKLIPSSSTVSYQGDNSGEIEDLKEKIEDLQDLEVSNSEYISDVQKILNGEVPERDTKTEDIQLPSNDTATSSENIENTTEIQENRTSPAISTENIVTNNKVGETTKFYFTPVRGTLTQGFSAQKQHLAQDIAAPKGEPVKSISDGVVLFADWTSSTGYVVMIQHPNNMISVYKHNSQVYKKVGDNVRTGEVIAAVGNTGEITTGPHLHFEIWVNGIPKDPKKYISF